MPYSSSSGKDAVAKLVRRYTQAHPGPYSVLDFGCGSGTYSNLFSDTLKGHWIGVEIFEPYIEQFNLRDKYDMLLVDDAIGAIDQLLEAEVKPHVIFIGDMLEHMPRDKAIELITKAKQLLYMNGLLVVSVPIGEYPQDEYMGNPHEAHVDTWHSLQELKDLGACYTHLHNEIGIGVFSKLDIERLLAPKFAVYMITKNEEQFIKRAIESVEKAAALAMINVDLVVCDTGSTDGTLAMLEQPFGRGSVHVNLIVRQINVMPWRFDDARNTALSFVPADVDVCVSLDADEVLSTAFFSHLLRCGSLLEHCDRGTTFQVNHSFETIWDWQGDGVNRTSHFHERIHSRFGLRWVHPVHEKLVPSGHDQAVHRPWCSNANMTQLPDTSKDRTSYKDLLEVAVKEDPTDWKLLTFLAAEHTPTDARKAMGYYHDSLKCPDVDKCFVYGALAHLHEFFKELEEAEDYRRRAVKIAPEQRETLYALAKFYQRAGDLEGYKRWMQAAASKGAETKGYHRNEAMWDGRFEKELAALNQEYSGVWG